MKNILNRLWRDRRFSNLRTIVHALLLTLATYMLWNIRYDWTDGGAILQRINLLRVNINHEERKPDDLLLINTCYDHEFVTAYDKIGIPCGELSVTDRSKLLQLMQALRSEGDYRYVVCDIAFDTNRCSDADSALYATIASMPRCVVPQLSDCTLPAVLRPKAAGSEYGITIVNNNFLKYQYLQHGLPSIALRMAMDMDSLQLHRWGPFYFIDGRLCNNCHVVDMTTRVRSEYAEDGTSNILQLGAEVLPTLEVGLTGMFTDKIVIIGDYFDQDIHTTVAGELSGPIITYNAYENLRDRKNEVSPLLLIMIFLAYGLLIWLIKRDSQNAEKWRSRLRIVLLLLVFVFFLVSGSYVDAVLMLGYFWFYRHVRSIVKCMGENGHTLRERMLEKFRKLRSSEN